MEKITNMLPGYKIYEYSLVLNPHEDLRNKILKVKQHFSEEFKVPGTIYSNPYINLVKYTQYEMFEDRIRVRLRTIGMGQRSLKIELKDFGSFPSHTIFINMISKLPVQGLVKQIRSEIQRLLKLDADHKPHFMQDPHIYIASKLDHQVFEKAWPAYREKHFSGRFIADGMILLKRVPGELKYQVIQRFEFENLPVKTKQGELFT